MNKFLSWIWSAIRWVGLKVVSVFEAIWNVLSSLLTWVIASVAYIIQLLANMVSSAISDWSSSVSDWFADVSDIDFPFQASGLFGHLFDLFALGDAATAFGIVLVVFVSSRLMRLALIPLRAVLEVA